MENKVIMMLQKVLGEGKVQVSVETDVDFDRAQERYREHQPVIADIDGKKQLTKVAERSSVEKESGTEAASATGTAVGSNANQGEGVDNPPNQTPGTTTGAMEVEKDPNFNYQVTTGTGNPGVSNAERTTLTVQL